MGNQFDARLIWHRREIWTRDGTTGARAAIRDLADGSEKPFKWVILYDGGKDEGSSKSEQAARAAVRLRVARLPVKATTDP